MTIRRFIRVRPLAIFLIFTVLALWQTSSPAAAQSPTLAITGLTLTCSDVSVNYEVGNTPPTGELYVLLGVTGPSGHIGTTSGDGGNGGHSVYTTFDPPQPANTSLTVTLTLYHVGEPIASDSRTQDCSGGGGPIESGWPGDNRLNPDMTEHYTVYCTGDHINVWRAIPDSTQLDSIPIGQVVNLNGCTSPDTGLTVCRAGDTVTISGSNGNAAPAEGSKSFSYNACITSNGRVPPALNQPSVGSTAPQKPHTIEEVIEYCDYYYTPATEGHLTCVVLTSLTYVRSARDVTAVCPTAPFIVVAGPLWVRRRRRYASPR